ncbi:type II 3-dehydroquinate dehydratase [Rhodohalobacter barkolensis]|uniref:3-dehydroquinate dehydratase n=1 Tax=Rhodohalobacter barkolensis TaxID=2053187 RepID=A0A2N0VHJ9_9BACT|nr:type II 3-dehydroquinate dehydratase [Rhodohalobacter barkolensis]PKD43676.1 type II 3-dehydroquinate dehydratase [Rhodohalobacter barkolensis]
MKILVLNGPNLNMLGKRDPEVYGSETLTDIEENLQGEYPNVDFEFLQSNHEGELIDAIQKARDGSVDALIANWGGFTHSSVAIHDALELLEIPKVEVHLSNIHAREEFRERSITGKAMNGIITGFGSISYTLGVEAALKILANR